MWQLRVYDASRGKNYRIVAKISIIHGYLWHFSLKPLSHKKYQKWTSYTIVSARTSWEISSYNSPLYHSQNALKAWGPLTDINCSLCVITHPFPHFNHGVAKSQVSVWMSNYPALYGRNFLFMPCKAKVYIYIYVHITVTGKMYQIIDTVNG